MIVEVLFTAFFCNRALMMILYYFASLKLSFSFSIDDVTAAIGYSDCPTRSCSAFVELLPCYCNTMCEWFRDCCGDYNRSQEQIPVNTTREEEMFPDRSLLECVRPCVKEATSCIADSVPMITKCPIGYVVNPLEEVTLNVTASCSEPVSDLPPVTDNTTGIVYRNIYCALCNMMPVSNMVEWHSVSRCKDSSIPEVNNVTKSSTFHSCFDSFYHPPYLEHHTQRLCSQSLVTTCPDRLVTHDSDNSSVDYDKLAQNCTKSGIDAVLLSLSISEPHYANPYCAICNIGLTDTQKLPCHYAVVTQPNGSKTLIPSTHPFGSEPGWLHHDTGTLPDLIHDLTIYIDFVKHANFSRLYNNRAAPVDPRHRLATDILSYIGLVLDIVSGIFILITYCSFKDLQTLYGKLLLNMVIITIASDVSLVMGYPISKIINSNSYCTAMSIVIHLVFLARFFSCSVLFCEATRTFYFALKVVPAEEKRGKQMCRYLCLYLIPVYAVSGLIVLTSVVLNFTLEGSIGYGYGVNMCWMSNRIAIGITFLAPLCLTWMFNCCCFIFCTLVIIRQSNFSNITKDNHNTKTTIFRNFRVITAFFSVSGISWISFILVLIPGSDGGRQVWGSYIFVILNSSQLLLVALAYVCTKKVLKKYVSTARKKAMQMSCHAPVLSGKPLETQSTSV